MITALLICAGISSLSINLSSEFPVSYTIEASLDTASQTLSGGETVRFRNPTSDALDSICFHLYPNAFSDTASIYCREDQRVRADVASGNISRLEVADVQVEKAAIDQSSIRIDGTRMYIALPVSLPPGRDIEISMRFDLLVPKAKVRFGHDGRGDYLFSHWYPILCGYEGSRLVDAEYHANSEFFSAFGFYDVTMKLPSNFVVGSTGQLTLGENSDTLAIWHAVADTVIDFAFACGRNFERFESDTLGVKISYLLTENGAKRFQTLDDISKYSLAYCSNALFPYPYADFTVVEFNSGSTGMELPEMIAIEISKPEEKQTEAMLESLVAHETIHQWFYGMIASNEIDEPWLDEGLTSFFEQELMDSKRQDEYDFTVLGFNFDYDDLTRMLTLSRRAPYPINLKSYNYPEWLDYETAVYYRAEMALQCLELSIGDSLFTTALKEYSRRFRFRHPTTRHFEKVIFDATGIDLNNFYSQFISGTARVDYCVSVLEYTKLKDSTENSTRYRISVSLRREQDGILPQRLTVRLEDGNVIDTTWDGRDRIAKFEFEAHSKPKYASIDEYARYPLDEDISNNKLYYDSFAWRLITFDWDSVSLVEIALALIL